MLNVNARHAKAVSSPGARKAVVKIHAVRKDDAKNLAPLRGASATRLVRLEALAQVRPSARKSGMQRKVLDLAKRDPAQLERLKVAHDRFE